MSLFGAKKSLPCDAERILIADDEESIRKLFVMILASWLPNVKADEAHNGLEAVRLFSERHHGVILMDLRMPEMDGLQAFLTIQDACQSEVRTMPAVIFCTGFAPPDGVTRIVGDGTYHYLMLKPVKSTEIVKAVTSRLDIIKRQTSIVK